MRLPTRILALLLTAVCANHAHASIIYGNLDRYSNDSGGSNNGSFILGQQSSTSGFYSGKAIGFTMGVDAYSVTSLKLRLGNVAGTTDAPSISIWTNNGFDVPGTQVGTFTNPVTFNGATKTDYVFTPASSITLSAGAKYFVVAQQLTPFSTGVDNSYNWYFGSPSVSAAGVASNTVVRFGNTSASPRPSTRRVRRRSTGSSSKAPT